MNTVMVEVWGCFLCGEYKVYNVTQTRVTPDAQILVSKRASRVMFV